jgi:hypothetical protein
MSIPTPSRVTWPTKTSLHPEDLAEMLNEFPEIVNAADAFGTVVADRVSKWKKQAFTGAQIQAGTGGVVAWQNPEAGSILVLRVLFNLTTPSDGACTLDIGTTPTSATTTSDNLLDGIDANAAAALFDSMNPALDAGANANAKILAAGKWITIDEKTGDATGLAGDLYVEYINI